jgi:hypothetical protein
MSLKTSKRIELAEKQLETAIGLFVSGRDKFSVISLAGAADVILCRLVSNIGKENFTEYLLKQEDTDSETCKTKESYGRAVNDMLFINDCKHMDEGDDGLVEIDLDECATAVILKALANYVKVRGRDKDFVKAFLAWVRLNLDPKKYNIDCDLDWKPR